jgi:hypothetical protein
MDNEHEWDRRFDLRPDEIEQIARVGRNLYQRQRRANFSASTKERRRLLAKARAIARRQRLS